MPRTPKKYQDLKTVDVDPSGRFDKRYGLTCPKYYVYRAKECLNGGDSHEAALRNSGIPEKYWDSIQRFDEEKTM